MKRSIALVYGLAGMASALLSFWALMWAVWGAPIHWTQFAGLFSSLLLVIAAAALAIRPAKTQQWICAIAVLGMGCFYVPELIALIPAAGIRTAPWLLAIEAAYFGLLLLVLRVPNRLAHGTLLFSVTFVAATSLAATTYVQRRQTGEYDRPAIMSFVCTGQGTNLLLDGAAQRKLSPALVTLLKQSGLKGELRFAGSANDDGRPSKLVVIAQRPVIKPAPLRYPKHGSIIYWWDGVDWHTLPHNAATYDSFATLEPDGMIEVTSAFGSTMAFGAFPWQRTTKR